MTGTLDAEEMKALRERYVPRGVTTAHPIVADHALGSELWDTAGRRYIDFVGGIGVMNVGHNHPRVMAAVREQLDRATHTAFQVVMYESYLRLAERLCAVAPGDGEKNELLHSTGAEPVEHTDKLARRHWALRGDQFHRRLPRKDAAHAQPDRHCQPLQAELRPVRGGDLPDAISVCVPRLDL